MKDTHLQSLAKSIATCTLLCLGSAQTSAQDRADGLAEAPQTGAGASASANVDVSTAFDARADSSAAPSENGSWLVGGKVGGIASFNGLDPFVHAGIELGYVFPTLEHGLAAYLQVEYSAPSTDGQVTEDFDPDRVPGGVYTWKIRQQEFVFAPTVAYRMTFLSELITPYVGIGPRVYLLRDTVHGKAVGVKIDETHERSTKWGLGLPLGAELALGPGKLTGELLFQWGPLKHTLTGSTHLGGASLFVGYRLLL